MMVMVLSKMMMHVAVVL